MKVVVTSDERTKLTDAVVDYLKELGHTVVERGILAGDSRQWVEIGREAALLVSEGKVDRGVIFCWSGTGITMAANRVKGARAALCWTPEIAKLARKWDDANILVMALVNTKEEVAKEMIEEFFKTDFDEEGLDECYKLDT